MAKMNKYEKTIRGLLYLLAVYLTLILLTGNTWATVQEDPLGPTLQEQLLKRAQEWNIMKVINETIAAMEVPDDFCVWDDLGNGTRYLEYCLTNNGITQCHHSTEELAKCEELEKK